MDIIDDKGRLLGTINIIDALVVLLVLAVAAAGAAFVLGTNDQPSDSNPRVQGNQSTNTTTVTNTTVTLQVTGVQPYIADAIPEGFIGTNRIVAVKNKSIRPTEVIIKDQNGTLHERTHPRKQTVTIRVRLRTTVKNGEPRFSGKPLEVGRQVTVDFGHVTTMGTITNVSGGTDVNRSRHE